MPTVDVERTFLEMRSPDALRPSHVVDPRVRVEQLRPCPVPVYRALYRDVGGAHHWRDRLAWSDELLAQHLSRADVAVWVLRVGEELAGYYEMRRHDDSSVEIVYFGLVPRFIGRGLGGHLLTHAVEEAWHVGTTRVWLHTCTLDSPNALPNYRSRGFSEFHRERYQVELPEQPDHATI